MAILRCHGSPNEGHERSVCRRLAVGASRDSHYLTQEEFLGWRETIPLLKPLSADVDGAKRHLGAICADFDTFR